MIDLQLSKMLSLKCLPKNDIIFTRMDIFTKCVIYMVIVTLYKLSNFLFLFNIMFSAFPRPYEWLCEIHPQD